MAIGDILPASYNPRAITENAFNGLRTSIKEFGIPQPIIVNKRNMVCVGGHMRLKAAEAEGLKTVPVIFVDLDEARERALNVALNSSKISGYFTDDLQEVLAGLRLNLDSLYTDLKLDELEINDDWTSDIEAINNVEENLDGIKATIKVKCPQEIKDEVLIYLKSKLMETSFEGVEVV